MSAALAPSPTAIARPPGLSLERRLEAALAAAREHGEAPCPVCGEAMVEDRSELRCAGCGSRLS